MLFSSKGDCPRETKTIARIFLAISSLMQCKQKILHFTQIENSTLFHFCARIANSKSSTLPFFNVFFSHNTFQRKGVDSVELAKDWNKHNFFSYPEMVFLLLHRLSCDGYSSRISGIVYNTRPCIYIHSKGEISFFLLVSSVRSSYSHPDLLLTHQHHHPLFQITPVLNTGLSLSEPLQLYKGYNAI